MTIKTAFTAAVLALSLSTAANAWTPEKDITFVIPWSPGGGFDLTARMLAPGIEEYFKEKGSDVKVIPRNAPGAGGRKAAKELFETDGDGYTIMMFNTPGHAYGYISDTKESYDITKFTYLNTATFDNYVIIVSKDGKYHTLDELKNAEIVVVPEQGPGNTNWLLGDLVWDSLGIKTNRVPGFKGSQPALMSVRQGESDAFLMVRTSAERNKDSLEIVVDLSDYPEWKNLGNVKTIVGPPNMDPEIAKELNAAIAYAINSSHFNYSKVGVKTISQKSVDETKSYVFSVIDIYKKK